MAPVKREQYREPKTASLSALEGRLPQDRFCAAGQYRAIEHSAYPITLLNRGGFFALTRQNMPKAQVLTQHEHGLSQAYLPAGEDRELNW